MNDTTRVSAKCAQACGFYLLASKNKHENTLQIKRPHNCKMTFNVPSVNRKCLMEKYACRI